MKCFEDRTWILSVSFIAHHQHQDPLSSKILSTSDARAQDLGTSHPGGLRIASCLVWLESAAPVDEVKSGENKDLGRQWRFCDTRRCREGRNWSHRIISEEVQQEGCQCCERVSAWENVSSFLLSSLRNKWRRRPRRTRLKETPTQSHTTLRLFRSPFSRGRVVSRALNSILTEH